MENKDEDYVLLTPCCKTSSISCYILADLNSINASLIEPERHINWCHSDAFGEVWCDNCGKEWDTIELVVSDKKLLETNLKWEG
tara:strand:+ start:874 stop:1125 length:252 start_codon:yes stop_codon:yes gene_type:complete